MRLGLIVLLCLVNAGCAIVRRDAEEPVDNAPAGQGRARAQAQRGAQPKSLRIASPITDHFYMRGTFFPASVATDLRLDPNANFPARRSAARTISASTTRSTRAAWSSTSAWRERNHVRIDYFKLNRFSEAAAGEDIVFGDFGFPAGTNFRAKLDWRVLTITYTYSLFKTDRFEGGLGTRNPHHRSARRRVASRARSIVRRPTMSRIFPTIAANLAHAAFPSAGRSRRAASSSRPVPKTSTASMADYHADVQFRWRKNLAFGLGYSMLKSDLEVFDPDQPLLFNLDDRGTRDLLPRQFLSARSSRFRNSMTR